MLLALCCVLLVYVLIRELSLDSCMELSYGWS